MRIAVLADVHGNLRALDAVQADLAARAPDLIVNLGDHLSGPLDAAATADALMAAPYIHIRGNHDRQLFELPVATMGLSDRAAHGRLTSLHLEWLAALPPSRSIDGDVLLCHGSPLDDRQFLLEDMVDDRVHLAPPNQIRERLGTTDHRLVLCAHSHIPRVVELDGSVCLINPGSVGLQAYDDNDPHHYHVETGSPHARYAIVDWNYGKARVELIAVEYDWHSAARDAGAGNRPDWAHALRTGYALRA